MPADLDIVPVSRREGERTYFSVEPYILEPKIILQVRLYDEPAADQSIGQVVGSGLDEQQPMQRHPCGTAQGWFYPADRLLVIWECMLSKHFSDAPLLDDPNMSLLWQALEAWAVREFPDAQRIATPFRDPQYEDTAYQAFLARLGYQSVAKAAFGKPVEAASQPEKRQ